MPRCWTGATSSRMRRANRCAWSVALATSRSGAGQKRRWKALAGSCGRSRPGCKSGREEERANVAREIHDELGQVLTAIKMNLDWLERRIDEHAEGPALNPLLERVVESAEMTDSAIKSVQRIATDLRPGALDNLGLAEALLQEANGFQQRSGITCEMDLPAGPLNLPGQVATAVFRVFQEALTNVGRHAKATTVHVLLKVDAGTTPAPG